MEVDRDLEARRPLEDREVPRVVEIGVADVRVDVPALEPEFGDAALQLVRRLPRCRDRQAREADEPGGVRGDESREDVVRLARMLDLNLGLELLEARARDTEELDGDTGAVHRRDARLAQVEQRRPQLMAVREDDVGQRRLEPHPDVLVGELEAGRRRAAFQESRVLRGEEVRLEVDLGDPGHTRLP